MRIQEAQLCRAISWNSCARKEESELRAHRRGGGVSSQHGEDRVFARIGADTWKDPTGVDGNVGVGAATPGMTAGDARGSLFDCSTSSLYEEPSDPGHERDAQLKKKVSKRQKVRKKGRRSRWAGGREPQYAEQRRDRQARGRGEERCEVALRSGPVFDRR